MFDLIVLHDWLISLPPLALALFVVALLDLASGAYLAWEGKYFRAEELPRFLQTLGGYALAWLLSEILAIMPDALNVDIPGWGEALADVTPKAVLAAIIVGKYVTSIVVNIKALLEYKAHPPFENDDELNPVG